MTALMARIQLYPHQLEAVKRIENGNVVCGGVGSGKSLTAIAWFYLQNGGAMSTLTGGRYVEMTRPVKDLYIITTARKRDTSEWEKELAPFLLSGKHYGNKVVIDSWNNIQKYIGVTDAVFIFDEQRVVGSGVWVKSFLKITKRNQWILLSATPGDTWMDYVPLFVANGFFKNMTEFRREHVVWSQYTKYPKVERYLGEKRLRGMRDLILVDMDFRRETVSHHEDIYTAYDIQQYKEIIRMRFDPWKQEPIENAGGLCYCMRKCVNTHESRQQALLEIFEAHKKLIIFYNFDYELQLLKELAEAHQIPCAEWNGHRHEAIPKDRQWWYLVQYSAGAEGWNCIETDTILFFSQNYSYKVMVQASGRIDRLNTPFHDLYYYHLKSRSGIDLAISRALASKRNFNESRFVKW